MTMAMAMPPPSSTTSVVEITVISIEGLKNYTSCLNPTIRPFITLTKLPPISTVHDAPTATPRWDHKLRVPVDPSFFSDGYSCLQLQLFTERRIVGPAQLGGCLIPASDIGLLPPGSVRYLSYRLRGRDGSRGHAIINISITLEGQGHTSVDVPCIPPNVDTCRTVIGIPVTAIRGTGKHLQQYRHDNVDIIYNK